MAELNAYLKSLKEKRDQKSTKLTEEIKLIDALKDHIKSH